MNESYKSRMKLSWSCKRPRLDGSWNDEMRLGEVREA